MENRFIELTGKKKPGRATLVVNGFAVMYLLETNKKHGRNNG